MSLGDEIRGKMPLIIDPIDTAGIPDRPSGITSVRKGTTGLDINLAIPYLKDQLLDHLEKLDFGIYVKNYYDCEDRAFWGMAHLRRYFPGCPVGVAVGEADYLTSADKGHAIIVLWHEVNEGGKFVYKPVYWDPLKTRGEVTTSQFHIKSVLAFPIGIGLRAVEPLTSYNKSLDKHMLIFDTERLIYDTRTGDHDKPGILEYLERKLYKGGPFKCVEIDKGAHGTSNIVAYRDKWKNDDRALWAFVHVRRAYPGCSVGVAIGQPKVSGGSTAVLAIWPKGGKPSYWDPKLAEIDPKLAEIDDFDAKLIFV